MIVAVVARQAQYENNTTKDYIYDLTHKHTKNRHTGTNIWRICTIVLFASNNSGFVEIITA